MLVTKGGGVGHSVLVFGVLLGVVWCLGDCRCLSFGWVNIGMPVNVEGCVGVVLWYGLTMFNGFKERGCDCCVRYS